MDLVSLIEILLYYWITTERAPSTTNYSLSHDAYFNSEELDLRRD